MLSILAWEALGSPSHVAFGCDDNSYWIQAGNPLSITAVRVHKNRHVSLGVIAEALAGQRFPLRIALIPDADVLHFGTIELVEA